VKPEARIESALLDRVAALGGVTRKAQWIGRRGAPDRFVMLPSGCFWVECKAPGEKPRPEQLREFEQLRKYGQRVLVIDSLEQVAAL
jgi:hypothetical protein